MLTSQPNLDEITSIEDIQKLVLAGFTDWLKYGHVTVRAQGDVLIFNYNPMAQYEGRWNFFETVSRGLIINKRTGEIVARAFDKFHNWFQGGRRAKGHIVVVTEKVDGSVGVLYRTSQGYKIATRGSFNSAQAEWATKFLNDHFDLTGLANELTLIFEIIYPENRIIVDYGTREDLVLLAARNRFTGDYLPFFPDLVELATHYGFTLPQVYNINDITTILEKTGAIDFNEEGYVVEFSDGSRFKFKGDRYLELARLVSGLTFKNTLRAMEAGSVREMINAVPDEFLTQVKVWISEIKSTIERVTDEMIAIFETAPKESRKDFALWVQTHHKSLSRYLFALYDNEDLEPLIYKHHKWGHREEETKFEDM